LKTKEIYLKDIKQGDKVVSSFLVTEKNMAFSQKGFPYLTVRLKDRSGEIESKVWDNAAQLDQRFKKGDIILIEGRAVSYKNSVQVSVTDDRFVPLICAHEFGAMPTWKLAPFSTAVITGGVAEVEAPDTSAM